MSTFTELSDAISAAHRLEQTMRDPGARRRLNEAVNRAVSDAARQIRDLVETYPGDKHVDVRLQGVEVRAS